MTIACPKCKAKLKLSEERARPEGTRIKCPKCGAILVRKGKARKELPEKEEQIAAAVQPPARGQFEASPPVAEPWALPGLKEHSSEESLFPPAPEGTTVREREAGAPPVRKKPSPALRETRALYSGDKASLPAEGEEKKALPGRAVMAGSAAGVLVLLLLAVFFFRSSETGLQKQLKPEPSVEVASQPQAPAPPQENAQAVMPESALPPSVPLEDMSSATSEEKAIAMVKRSDVLLKMTSVEAIVDKWTQDNAGRYKIAGWQAKQIEDQQYLVSYTAFEGNTPKGFYFVADIQGGTVQDLADNPELQKKYNIQYSR